MQHTAISIAAAAVLGVCLVAAWVMLSGASARAGEESEKLKQTGVSYGKNDAEMESAKKRVEESNAEMNQLSRLVSLGPVTQQIADVVARVLNESANNFQGTDMVGFESIHVMKISAKFIPVSVQIPGSNKVDTLKVPEITFEAKVRDLGARPAAASYTSFVENLRERVIEKKGFKETVGQLVATNNTFVFQIRAKTPAELEAEVAK
jgi:hypothetical protein